jgi:hypothetical protein
MQRQDRDKHLVSAAEALSTYRTVSGVADDHSIADLICDLGHLSEEMGVDYLAQLQKGISHWYTEKYCTTGQIIPSLWVEISIRAK